MPGFFRRRIRSSRLSFTLPPERHRIPGNDRSSPEVFAGIANREASSPSARITTTEDQLAFPRTTTYRFLAEYDRTDSMGSSTIFRIVRQQRVSARVVALGRPLRSGARGQFRLRAHGPVRCAKERFDRRRFGIRPRGSYAELTTMDMAEHLSSTIGSVSNVFLLELAIVLSTSTNTSSKSFL